MLYQRTASSLPTARGLLGRFEGDHASAQRVAFKGWPVLPYGKDAAVSTPEPQGLGLALWLNSSSPLAGAADRTLLQAGGVSLKVTAGKVELVLADASSGRRFIFTPDVACQSWLGLPGPHFVGFTVDAGARMVTAVVDGVLCDGGAQGWWIHPKPGDDFQGFGFLPANISSLGGEGHATIGPMAGEAPTRPPPNTTQPHPTTTDA